MNRDLKKVLFKILLILVFKIYSINTYSNNLNYKKINRHLTQLEHISEAHSQYLTQLQKQLSHMEQEINFLRGQIQTNEHNLLKIIENQNYINKKINLTIKENLNVEGEKSISDCSKKTYNNSLFPSVVNIDNNQHYTAYHKSVKLVLENKQYEKAIQSFQEFILKYPNSQYQSNAHYWLGQLHYRKGNKNEASYHFALVAQNYPKSSKASDALLKVGMIMEENGYKEKAKLIYKEVSYLYPNTDASKNSKKRSSNLIN